MGRSTVYRSFKGTQRAQQRAAQKKLRATMSALKARVQANTLTDDDHRILARLGPELLAYVGYERRVELS